jgi:hypothetical protein
MEHLNEFAERINGTMSDSGIHTILQPTKIAGKSARKRARRHLEWSGGYYNGGEYKNVRSFHTAGWRLIAGVNSSSA